MTSHCDNYRIVEVGFEDPIEISDTWFSLLECDSGSDSPYLLGITLPWGRDDRWVASTGSLTIVNPDKVNDYIYLTFHGGVICGYINVKVERCFPVPLAFADVAISRRYGDRLYLSGKLKNIVTSDEICIKYFRPEDGTVHNLPGSGLDYTYLKGTSGTYTFPDDACIPIWDDKFVSGHWEGNEYINAHYEDTGLPGLYVLLVYDVSGSCEDTIQERLRATLSVQAPRYQYQVAFKTADLDFPEAVAMLEARRREWARVTDKRVEPYAKDCLSVRLKYTSGWADATGLVWLCSAYQARTMAKFMPIPSWVGLDVTEYLEYFRGECNCAEFQESRKYGIPCVHLMAAYYYFDRKPPHCAYIQCP